MLVSAVEKVVLTYMWNQSNTLANLRDGYIKHVVFFTISPPINFDQKLCVETDNND